MKFATPEQVVLMLPWPQIQVSLFISFIIFFFLLAPKKNSSQVAGLATQFGFPSVTSIPATSERAGCLSQCGLREDMHRGFLSLSLR